MTASPAEYRAGTLVYTRRDLFLLSSWLLWGDFAFTFFEAIFGRFVPIYLKDLGASNTLIGLMTGSFAGLVNILFLPRISQWCDNHRSARGRRIPFLYAVTPLTVVALVAVGFAPEIGAWAYRFLPGGSIGLATQGTLVLGLLCFFVVGFHFFNMILVNAYNWLIRDVVPLEVMSRFLAWFRVVGAISSIFFLWFVFPHMLVYRREIFASIGLFYLAAFLLMALRVKEGEYPPPANPPRLGLLRSFQVYFRECLQIPLYRNFLIVYLLVLSALNCAAPFGILFAKSSLGLTMDDLGRVYSITAIISAVSYFPFGWLCDRYSPLHVTGGAVVTFGLASVLAYFLVGTERSYLVYLVVFTLPSVAWNLGSMALAMKLFPLEKFGQFSGALNVFGSGGLIFGNLAIGFAIDAFSNDYRLSFLWTGLLIAMALPFLLMVYRDWKRHGGRDHYIAPLPD